MEQSHCKRVWEIFWKEEYVSTLWISNFNPIYITPLPAFTNTVKITTVDIYWALTMCNYSAWHFTSISPHSTWVNYTPYCTGWKKLNKGHIPTQMIKSTIGISAQSCAHSKMPVFSTSLSCLFSMPKIINESITWEIFFASINIMERRKHQKKINNINTWINTNAFAWREEERKLLEFWHK